MFVECRTLKSSSSHGAELEGNSKNEDGSLHLIGNLKGWLYKNTSTLTPMGEGSESLDGENVLTSNYHVRTDLCNWQSYIYFILVKYVKKPTVGMPIHRYNE